ncbi:heterokaryon incompatibility protein-domain-containing protein [Rhypophila decipiens]|uniref:Heterokaryon incompatibility protein-domain-containing protein n=1 Tax=Rhypophila decipiens TaxID=261697 RepID=A0AAN6Y169_9PEZI|nr:heterokaryon incompatibility protein-domain-containing protein [Rhypophila decipiens]
MCILIFHFNGTSSKVFSNRADLEKEAFAIRKAHRPEAQRILLSWRHCAAFGQIQRLASPDKPEDEGFFGRLVQSHRIDWSLLRFWIRHCSRRHAGICQDRRAKATREGLHRNMRVIDTVTRMVVPYRPELEYFALTYVWGERLMKDLTGRRMPKMNRQLVRTQSSPNGTIPLPTWLPRTINDAIEAVELLGYRVLWVDSLCIIQDDDADRHSQLLRMDAIYRNASPAIAAASGSHADCGLPGMSIPRRFQQQRGTVSDVTLSVPHPRFDELNVGNTLKWNTRAWTFQEKVLSKRLLIFTDYQLYYRCANGVWSEDTATETTRPPRSNGKTWFAWGEHKLPHDYSTRRPYSLVDFLTFGSLELAISERHGSFANYAAVTEEYTQRTLTFHRDALPAIDGVLRILDPTPVAYVAGLPRKLFHTAMLWNPKIGGTATEIPDSGAPSWSWARWSLSEGWSRLLSSLGMPRGLGELPPMRKALEISGSLLGWWASLGKGYTIGRILTKGIVADKEPDDKVVACELRRSETLVIGEMIMTMGAIRRVSRRPSLFDFVELSRGKELPFTSKLIPESLQPSTTEEVYVPGKLIQGDTDENRPATRAAGHYESRTTIDPSSEWKVVNVMLVERPDQENLAYRRGIGKVLLNEWEKLPVWKEFMVLG